MFSNFFTSFKQSKLYNNKKEIEINEPKKKFQSKVKVSKYSNNDKGIF